MKKIFLIFVSMFTFAFGTIDSVRAVTVSGVTYPFSITTSSIAKNGTFTFYLGAKGTFYVDCGTGGTLSGTGASGGTITKSNVTQYTYTCTYSSAGTKTIQFGGVATEYSVLSDNSCNSSKAALLISTNSRTYVKSLSGDLSAIFPYLGLPASGLQPTFTTTFYNCTNLTSIPNTLFSGYTTAGKCMFGSTFNGCTGLTSLPDRLFANITSVDADSTPFADTFENCTNLTGYVPFTLFQGLITNDVPSSFWFTFYNTGLSTSCSSGKVQYITGYESDWSGKVSCGDPITCSSGTYLPAGSTTCTMCLSGYTCPGGTFGGSNASQGLTVTCSSGYYLPANSTTCTTCPTGYTCAGGTFTTGTTIQGRTPKIFAITLRSHDNATTYGKIYEKYATGWYSDSAATIPITSAPIPTRSGYTFRGYYTSRHSDLTATGGAGTRRITSDGGLPSNTQYTTGVTVYAAWATNCAPGTGCTCNLNLASNGSVVTYTTTPNTGYTITSGFGTYAPTCTKNTINMTFDGVATTPSQCTLDGTFVPPTPTPRTGYVFTGWKVKTITKPYTQLEYLQSDGNQYIDTNTVADLNTKAEIKFAHTQLDSSVNYYVFGYYSSSTPYSCFGLGDDSTRFRGFMRSYSAYVITSPKPVLNTDYVVEMSKTGYVINGTTKSSTVSYDFTSGDIYLFKTNGMYSTATGSTRSFIGKIYYLKLYENGTLVHNFVPARRNSDSVLGMYDTVSNVFLTNSGTGTFTAGPNVGQVGN